MQAATKNKYYDVSFYYYTNLDKMKNSRGDFYVSV